MQRQASSKWLCSRGSADQSAGGAETKGASQHSKAVMLPLFRALLVKRETEKGSTAVQ